MTGQAAANALPPVGREPLLDAIEALCDDSFLMCVEKNLWGDLTNLEQGLRQERTT